MADDRKLSQVFAEEELHEVEHYSMNDYYEPIFGGRLFELTEKDLEHLRKGGAICVANSEYAHYLRLKNG